NSRAARPARTVASRTPRTWREASDSFSKSSTARQAELSSLPRRVEISGRRRRPCPWFTLRPLQASNVDRAEWTIASVRARGKREGGGAPERSSGEGEYRDGRARQD